MCFILYYFTVEFSVRIFIFTMESVFLCDSVNLSNLSMISALAPKPQNQTDLWEQLEHIVTQLKSFKSSVHPEHLHHPTANKLVKPVRIRQIGECLFLHYSGRSRIHWC